MMVTKSGDEPPHSPPKSPSPGFVTRSRHLFPSLLSRRILASDGPKTAKPPSPPRPRRAEQVPSVLCLDATPERDAAPGIDRVLTCASTVASPETGAPAPRFGAPLSRGARGGNSGK